MMVWLLTGRPHDKHELQATLTCTRHLSTWWMARLNAGCTTMTAMIARSHYVYTHCRYAHGLRAQYRRYIKSVLLYILNYCQGSASMISGGTMFDVHI